MSKQHLWPEWMQTPFPKTGTSHGNFQLKIKRLQGRRVGLQPLLRTHQGDIKNRKLRIVCEYHCNNGWISHVEDGTKEFLVPMINGEFFTLTEEHQRKLALWLAVACTVWEYTDSPTKAIPKEDREYIYEKRQDPPNWSMWIGNYRGTEWKTRYRHHGFSSAPTKLFPERNIVGLNQPNGQNTSLQIGELFMHAASNTLPDLWQFEHGIDLPGMLRLWPVKGGVIQWPNIFTLDDAAANALAERMVTLSFESLKNVSW